jgi:hypothetical protein
MRRSGERSVGLARAARSETSAAFGSIILLESAKQFGKHIALDYELDGLRYEVRFPPEAQVRAF